MASLRRRHREPSPDGLAFRGIFDRFSDADRPVAFGPGHRWMAVLTNRPRRVAEVLGTAVAPSRWSTGVAFAGDDGRIFVTPPVDRWVLVPGHHATVDDLAATSGRLGEAQSFVADAARGELAWERWRRGEVVRRVTVRAPGQGATEVSAVGSVTDGEREAGIPEDLLDGSSTVNLDDGLVLAVAGAWSVDPTTLDGRTEPAGPGWLGRVIHYPSAPTYT